MKRSTVVRHLNELAELAGRLRSLAEPDEPVLRELWVGGDPTSPGAPVEHVVFILMLDIPADELPEIMLHHAEESFASVMRLDKRPMLIRSRPIGRPPWSHLERRVARVWSCADGTDRSNLNGLTIASLDGVEVLEPDDRELRAWLDTELARSQAHLSAVLDDYWDGDWRRRHTGGGVHPEDHLWRAAWAVQSMLDTIHADRPGAEGAQ